MTHKGLNRKRGVRNLVLLCVLVTGPGIPLISGIGRTAVAQGKDAPAYAQPAENLLLIVADIQRHLEDDVYRFPYATDVTGQNIFRSALVRLANYEKLYPGRMTDVVALAKAQAWERLCAFQEAAANYEKAQKSPDEAIRKLAGEGFERARRFALAAGSEVDQSSMRTFERDMRFRIELLTKLAEEFRGSPYECLAQVARERTQMQLAEFYVSMRFIQPYTTKEAEQALKKNAESNRFSKLRFAHHLRLADFYYERAREYTLKDDPAGADFKLKEFEALVNPARAEYKIVEEADGYPEKLEARAKLLALEAFIDRVMERAR